MPSDRSASASLFSSADTLTVLREHKQTGRSCSSVHIPHHTPSPRHGLHVLRCRSRSDRWDGIYENDISYDSSTVLCDFKQRSDFHRCLFHPLRNSCNPLTHSPDLTLTQQELKLKMFCSQTVELHDCYSSQTLTALN